jgi:uncharacterized protein (TIGR02688 family)
MNLREIQLSTRDILEKIAEGRAKLTTPEWRDFLLRSVGLEPAALSPRARDVMLLHMVPFVEHNYNMVELRPRGTGKSHLYQQVSPYAHLVSGGKATVARMFVNMANGQRGLVCQYDVVCFDEVSGISFDQKDGVNIMKVLHGIRRILAWSRKHRDARKLRSGCSAPAAGMPSVRADAPGNAQRHRLHGSHSLLSTGLRPSEGEQGLVHGSLRPCQRRAGGVLLALARPEPR